VGDGRDDIGDWVIGDWVIGRSTIVVDELPGLRRAVAKEFAEQARRAIAGRGRFLVALPGGSVADRFFPTLAALDLDWSRMEFFWIDERAVPPDDPESNYARASTLWLTRARVSASHIHRMRGEDPDLERAARSAEEELIAIAGNPPRLDLVLAGGGEDGHVASIFSGGTGLQPCPLVAAVYDAPKPPPRRLTLTMPVLARAERVVVAALGQSKAKAIREALKEKDCATPLAHLLRVAQSSIVILDNEAAPDAAL